MNATKEVEGEETNNRGNSCVRNVIKRYLYNIGRWIEYKPFLCLLLCFILTIVPLFIAIRLNEPETDIVKLWVPKGGRVDSELNYLAVAKHEFYNVQKKYTGHEDRRRTIPSSHGWSNNFQSLIQVPKVRGANVLNKEDLLRHVSVMEDVINLKVELYGRNWTLADICFKPPAPRLSPNDYNGVDEYVLENLMPCVFITPLDCFWEGSKLLGPNPPFKLQYQETYDLFDKLPRDNITWKNLDFGAFAKQLEDEFEVGLIRNFFEHAEVDSGYLDRSCIDPLDPECPFEAPNYFFRCNSLNKFMEWNAKNERVVLDGEDVPSTQNVSDKTNCERFEKSFLKWMDKNNDKWRLFLDENELPDYPEYADKTSLGCRGFGKELMKWPREMITGQRNQLDYSASALQTSFLLADAEELYYRILYSEHGHPSLYFTIESADEILKAWKRQFTSMITGYSNSSEERLFHAWTSLSFADTLNDFSHFNFHQIAIVYGLLFFYVVVSQVHLDGWKLSPKSCCGVSMIGMALVAYSIVVGFGVSRMYDIFNNAVTMRVVPFISLGLGVDNLFHVLHNYKRVLEIEKNHKIGILLEESGVQIVFSTITVVFAFLAGKLVPVPLVCSLCSQIAILLFVNMLVTLFAFPAFLAWDLRRRKSSRRGLLCCFTKSPETTVLEETQEESNQQLVNGKDIEAGLDIGVHNDSKEEQRPDVSKFKFYTLDGLLHRFYIPFLSNKNTQFNIRCTSAIFLLVFGAFAHFGLKTGLELTDILPKHTSQAEVLRLRNERFSTYPMYLITNGPLIDYPLQQQQLDQLWDEIGQSRFVAKMNEEPSELYWLKLMSHWLAFIQLELDKAIKNKLIDRVSGRFVQNDNRVTDEMRLGRRLICSHGNEFNCTGRIGVVQLVNKEGLINPESFYNYLTAWFNMDNTVYYISQAALFPTPPKWKFWPKTDELIPPAPELLYTQIPFYLTGLTSTDTNLKMIREIRSICDNYTQNGLHVFPTGIPFTFYDQYFSLNWNVKVAVFTICIVFLVLMLLVAFDFWIVGWITYILASVILEIGGIMVVSRIQLNPFSAVMFIASVGIGMQYSVHIAFAYLDYVGTQQQRVISCLGRTFTPIVHSGVTTILALVVLFFSDFNLIFDYFFGITVVSVVIGLLNGLVLLPALLMLVEFFLQLGRIRRKSYAESIVSSKKEKATQTSLISSDSERNFDTLSTIPEENPSDLSADEFIDETSTSEYKGH